MKWLPRPDISLIRMSAWQRLAWVLPVWGVLAGLVAWALAAP
jgi:hypothetical protein